MEFTGRIMKVFEPRTGTSEKTGSEWKTQGFIFEYFENPTDRYSDKVYLETFSESIMAQLKENLPVRIGFGHNTEDYNGRTFNRLKLYKFEPQAAVQTHQQPQADGGTGAAPAAQQPGTSGVPFQPQIAYDKNGNPISQEGEKDDDLPF